MLILRLRRLNGDLTWGIRLCRLEQPGSIARSLYYYYYVWFSIFGEMGAGTKNGERKFCTRQVGGERERERERGVWLSRNLWKNSGRFPLLPGKKDEVLLVRDHQFELVMRAFLYRFRSNEWQAQGGQSRINLEHSSIVEREFASSSRQLGSKHELVSPD